MRMGSCQSKAYEYAAAHDDAGISQQQPYRKKIPQSSCQASGQLPTSAVLWQKKRLKYPYDYLFIFIYSFW